jgi:PAS domain-containing protein
MDRDLATALTRSVRSTVDACRTLVSGGLGAYLGAVSLLGCSLGVTRILLTYVQSAAEVAHAVEALLHTPQEPYRPDPIPARGAALIGEMSIQWDICDARSRVSAELDEAYKQFVDRYHAALPSPTAGGADRQPLLTFSRPGRAPAPSGVRSQEPLLLLPSAADEGSLQRDVTTASVGDLRDPPSGKILSTFRVPSPVLCPTGRCEGETPQEEGRLREERERSRFALEELKPVLDRWTQSSGDPELPVLARFFFVAFDGAIRLMPPEPLDEIVPHHLWHFAPYVVDTVSHAVPVSRCSGYRRYESRPYADSLGLGLIATACYPVEKEDAPAGGAALAARVQRPEGVFCADVILPRRLVERQARSNGIYDVTLFELRSPKASNRLFDARRCKPDVDGYSCAEPVPQSDAAMPELARWWGGQRRPRRHLPDKEEVERWSRSDRAAPVLLWSGNAPEEEPSQGDSKAGVQDPAKAPGRSQGSVEEKRTAPAVFLVAKLRYRSSSIGSPGILALIAAVGLLVASLLVTTRAAVKSDRRRSTSVARSLQIGVVRMDVEGEIVDANDHAEVLLGQKLPRAGLARERDQQVFLADLIVDARDAVAAGERARLVEGKRVVEQRDRGYVVTRLPLGFDRRRRGLTGIYYAPFFAPLDARFPRWLRVICSPTMTSSRHEGRVATLEPVSPELRCRLVEALQHAEAGP